MPTGIYKRVHPPWNKGKNGVYSSEAILKMRLSKLEHGIVPPSQKGFRHSEETKIKIAIAHTGANNYRWRGGKETEKIRNCFYQCRREVRKYSNGGTHTLDQWERLKSKYNWTCPACKVSEPEIKLTHDHIVPISKGGSDSIENIQPLCKSCNGNKMTKTIKYE